MTNRKLTNGRHVVGYVLRKFPVLSETFILNEILALEARGVEVHIFALAPTRDPRFHEGIGRLQATIHYVPGASQLRTLFRQARKQAARNRRHYHKRLLHVLATGRPKLLWRFLQASYIADRAKRYGVRHLHAHFATHPATIAHQTSLLLGIPFSFTAHAYDIYRRGRDANVIVRKMRDARFTATVSEYNVAYLSSLRNGGRPRVELIRNGIDMQRFAPAAAMPDGPFTVLAVARLVEKKGLPILIEACRHLRDRGVDFRCEIVGKGEQRALLEQLVRDWKLSTRVHFVGALAQQQLLECYHRAHVLALPCVVSRDGNRDGLPVSIVEALACGVPVISTAVTGIPEAVQDGDNGLLVPERNPVALADAIERLYREPELLARLRRRARPSVVQAFDHTRTSARLHELITEGVA